MAERSLPTLFVREVLGAHADDPGFAKIGLRVLGLKCNSRCQRHISTFSSACSLPPRDISIGRRQTRTTTTASQKPRSMLGMVWLL
jgi:hypothetical protein